MRVPRVTPAFLRRLTTLNVLLLLAVVVSGAIVRLSNSGLGCRDWPNCSATQFVSVTTDHAAIEQINRIFSGLIGIPLALAVYAVYQVRPRRGDLILRAWILLGLFLCEAVVGGLSVHLQLAWFSVMSHFLLALALVSVALQLRQRVREPRPGGRRSFVRSLAVVRVVCVDDRRPHPRHARDQRPAARRRPKRLRLASITDLADARCGRPARDPHARNRDRAVRTCRAPVPHGVGRDRAMVAGCARLRRYARRCRGARRVPRVRRCRFAPCGSSLSITAPMERRPEGLVAYRPDLPEPVRS
jgi:hypothetical protein